MARFSWFPGHMARASRQITKRIKVVDLVIELRDARIPLSSGIPLHLEQHMQQRNHMVVLNKADLANPNLQQAAVMSLKAQGIPAMPMVANDVDNVRNLLKTIHQWIQQECQAKDALLIMVVGVPNCGKSSLINALHSLATSQQHYRRTAGRSRISAAQHVKKLNKSTTGPHPGVTRHLSSFRVNWRPSAFVVDTPGVMLPRIPDLETGYKLALTGAVKDSIVGVERLAVYLLFLLAKHRGALGFAAREWERRQAAAAERHRQQAAEARRRGKRVKARRPGGINRAALVERLLPSAAAADDDADDMHRLALEALDQLGARLGTVVLEKEAEGAPRASVAELRRRADAMEERERRGLPPEDSDQGDEVADGDSQRFEASKTLLAWYREGSLGCFTLDQLETAPAKLHAEPADASTSRVNPRGDAVNPRGDAEPVLRRVLSKPAATKTHIMPEFVTEEIEA